MVFSTGNNFLAFHNHVNEVVSHVEDCVRVVQYYVLVVVEAFKVVERKLLDLLEFRYVQRVFLCVLVVGQECSANSIVFVDCTLLDDLVLLTRYFVYN